MTYANVGIQYFDYERGDNCMKLKRKKIFKYIEWSIVVVLIIYACIMIFPQIFFDKDINYQNFTVHYNGEIDNKNVFSILDEVHNSIQKLDSYGNGLKVDVFICNNFNLYRIFAPSSPDSFAINTPVGNKIIYAKVDLKNDMVYTNKGNTSSFSKTLVHEITHTIFRKEFGAIQTWFSPFINTRVDILGITLVPKWKSEGYAEYIAKHSSFDIDEGISLFVNNKNIDSESYRYFTYRLYMTYLLDVKDETIEEIVQNKYNLENLRKEIIKAINENMLIIKE